MIALLLAATLALAYSDDCNLATTDMWAGDIYNFWPGNFQGCKDRCRTTAACVAVVYIHSGWDNGKCYLKNSGHWALGYCSYCTAALKPCITNEGPCPAGQYKTSTTTCGTCPANTYSTAGSWSCNACDAGYYSSAGASGCMQCPAGTYRSSTDAGCIECPANTYSTAGSGSCNACDAGYYSSAGASGCMQCPAGTYRSSTDAGCVECPANTYSPDIAAAACDACPAGTTSQPAAADCMICPAGTYRPTTSAECIACPENTYGEYTGATTEEDCTACAEHYVSPAGSTNAGDCEATNGDHCWGYEEGFRLTGAYGGQLSMDGAKDACFADADCVGFSCHKNKVDTCWLSNATDYKDARKYYTYVKEC